MNNSLMIKGLFSCCFFSLSIKEHVKQLISLKKNNPLKKTQQDKIALKKNTSILSHSNSILSSQRVRKLSSEITVT